MARLAVSMALLLSGLTTHGAHAAEQPDEDTINVANEVGVSPTELLGAINTLRDAGYVNVDARTYLQNAVGELAGSPPSPPAAPAIPACGWPICGALGQRIWCIEGMESRHGAAMWNTTPVWNGEHAQGFLGFLPSTARAWGVAIGNRASEWQGAARMLAAGAGRQFAGVAMGRC
jgi:hypothetical protein